MYQQTAPNAFGMVANNTQQHPSKKTADGFGHWFAKMDYAIKAGYGDNAIFAADICQSEY